jgi:hypothetical protein
MAILGPVPIRGDATPSSGNVLAVPLGATDRVVWIYLQPEAEVLGDRLPVTWQVTATLRATAPKTTFNDPTAALFQLRPERVTVAPIRAKSALVLAAFLPTAPTFEFLDVYFMGPPEPNYLAKAWAEASSVQYTACGLFPVPFGV